jgi:hypothetical protein
VFGFDGDFIIAVSATPFAPGVTACPSAASSSTAACSTSCLPSSSSCATADGIAAPLSGPFWASLPNATLGGTYHVAVDVGASTSTSFSIVASCAYSYDPLYQLVLPTAFQDQPESPSSAPEYWPQEYAEPDEIATRVSVSDEAMCLPTDHIDACTAELYIYHLNQGAVLYTAAPIGGDAFYNRQYRHGQQPGEDSAPIGCAAQLGVREAMDGVGWAQLLQTPRGKRQSRGGGGGAMTISIPSTGCKFVYTTRRGVPRAVVAAIIAGSAAILLALVGCMCCQCRCCCWHVACRSRANRCLPACCQFAPRESDVLQPASSAEASAAVFVLPQQAMYQPNGVAQAQHEMVVLHHPQPFVASAPPMSMPMPVHVDMRQQMPPAGVSLYPAIGGAYAPVGQQTNAGGYSV